MTHGHLTDPDIDSTVVLETLNIGAGSGIVAQEVDVSVDQRGQFAVVYIRDKINADNNATNKVTWELELERESPWRLVGVQNFQEVNSASGGQSFFTLGQRFDGVHELQDLLAVVHQKDGNNAYFKNFHVPNLDYLWETFEELYVTHTWNANGDGTATANVLSQTGFFLEKGAAGSTI